MLYPLPTGAPAITTFRPLTVSALLPVRGLRQLALVLIGWCLLAGVARAADSAPRDFSIPAGDAAVTLAEFARQSGEQIAFFSDNVRGQPTPAIEGRLTPYEALQRMLANTNLTVRRDPGTGAMTVVRRAEPPVPVTKPASPPKQLVNPVISSGEIITLPEFVVSSNTADRYRAADAISAIRVRTALLNTPASVSVMTRDAIDDIVPTRIFDVTRYIAGVQEGRGIQFSDRQIIRGFESNGRTVDNFFQMGADNFDEAVIDRIEVSKGPNAILAPGGVPGGSINVITKSPDFTRRSSVTALLGMFDAQKLTLDLSAPFSEESAFAYRIVGALQDTRRYPADDARLRGKVFAPMLTWQPSPNTQITGKLIYAEHWIFREPGLILDPRVGYDTDPPYLAPGFSYRSRNGIQPWSHVGTETWDGFVQLTSRLNEQLSLRVAANGRHYFEDSTQEFFSTPTLSNRYNPTTGVLTQDQTWALQDPSLPYNAATNPYVPTNSPFFNPTAIPVRGDTQATTVTTFNAQADLAANYKVGVATAQTIAGAAVSHYDSVGRTRSGTLPPLNLTQPDLLFDPVWSPTLSTDLRSKQNTWQVYVNQRFGLWDDKLAFTTGLMRYSVYTKSRNQLDPAAQPSILDDFRWLWLASVMVKPKPNLSVYLTGSSNSTPVIANNLPLWRDGRQLELGFKSEYFDQRLSFNAAAFKIRQTNVTVPNPDRQTDPSAPEQLISDLSDYGWELELTGGLTPRLSVVAAYSNVRLRDSLERRVRAVADHNGALLLNYRFIDGPPTRLSGFVGVTYSGSRAGDATSVNFTPLGVATKQSFVIPPHVLMNLGATCSWRNFRFQLNVDNVFDEKNYLALAGGRVSGTGLSAATGLNVKLTTTLVW